MTQPGEATLRWLQSPLDQFLDDPATTEVVIDRPGRVGVERPGQDPPWQWYEVPALSFDRLDAIATLAAAMTRQDLGPDRPRCSTVLPQGYRVQIARPPLTAPDTISLTIRKRASSFVPTIEWLADRGCFKELDPSVDWISFWKNRVERRSSILIGGMTGSGKTTVAEAFIRAIPLHERLITVEKTPEWFGLPHDSWSALYYGFAGDGEASQRAAVQCIEDALRMRPDRILVGELRAPGEAWAYVRSLMAGHPGGITTIHSDSPIGCLNSLATMLRGDAAGVSMNEADLRALLRQHIDVVVHCAKAPYRITSIVDLRA
jgi:type IV secretion system protein VirB11